MLLAASFIVGCRRHDSALAAGEFSDREAVWSRGRVDGSTGEWTPDLLTRRISALVFAADMLSARFVCRLLLPFFVSHDPLCR